MSNKTLKIGFFTPIVLGLLYLIYFSTIGCKKTPEYSEPFIELNQEQIYEQIHSIEPSLTKEEYLTNVGTRSNQYGIIHLNEFLSIYGLCDIPIIPAFNNYYQDIGQGGSYLGNLSKLGEDRFFSPDNIMLIDTTGYEFHWYIDGYINAVYNYANPDISDIYQCNGVFLLTLRITTPIGSKYMRQEFAYFDNPNIPDNDCICEGCPGQFEVFYDFYPPLPPYSYRYKLSPYDFNGNNCIDASDLTVFLQNFGV